MKVFREMYIALFIMVIFAMPMILLQGCGSKHEAAPSGSEIIVNPDKVDLANIAFYGDVIQNYVVTLQYADGTPIPDTDLFISGSFADPVISSTGPFVIPRYQFWLYPNANANPINVRVNSGFTAKTDESGNYNFSVQIYSSVTVSGVLVGNAFGDVIFITSGDAVGTTELNVTAN
jgi:hypothetical protein